MGKTEDCRVPDSRIYHGWLVVFCAFCVALFGWGLGFYGAGIYLATLKAQQGWSTATISTAITAYYLCGALLIGFVGNAMERYGARPVVLAGTAAMGLGVAGLSMVTQPWHVYPAFLVMSVGWAAMSGASINAMVAPWFDRRRGLAISLALNGASFGGVAMAPLLVYLIARWGFGPGLLVAVALMFIVLLPVVLPVLQRRDAGRHGFDRRDRPVGPAEAAEAAATARPAAPWRLGAVLRDRNFRTIVLPFSIGLLVQVGVLTHLVAFLTPSIGSEAAGWCISALSVAAVAGRIGTGFFIDRLDCRLAASVNFFLQVAALGILIWAPSPAALYAGSLLFGLGVGNLITFPGLIVQREFPREHFARIVSLVVAVNQFTYAFGPGLVGLIREISGSYTGAFALCLALHALAGLVVLMRRQPAMVQA